MRHQVRKTVQEKKGVKREPPGRLDDRLGSPGTRKGAVKRELDNDPAVGTIPSIGPSGDSGGEQRRGRLRKLLSCQKNGRYPKANKGKP